MKPLKSSSSHHSHSPRRTAIGLIVAVVMTLSLVAPGSAAAAGGGGSGSAGLAANPAFGPLSAKYWQWLLSIPAASNPAAVPAKDPAKACAPRQSGPVVFLAGSFEPDPVRRTCTVPRGKPLFFPLINIVLVSTEPPQTAPELWRELHVAKAWTVDTVSLKVGRVDILKDSRPSALYRGCAGPERGCAPGSFAFTLPKEPVFLAAGTYRPAIADGYYALLPPLPRGTTTITFGGAGSLIPDPDTGKVVMWAQDVTYELHVQ